MPPQAQSTSTAATQPQPPPPQQQQPHQQQQPNRTTTATTTTNHNSIKRTLSINTTDKLNNNSPNQTNSPIPDQEAAANELLARVDLNAALEFIQKQAQTQTPPPPPPDHHLTRTAHKQQPTTPTAQATRIAQSPNLQPSPQTNSTTYPSSLDIKTPATIPQATFPTQLDEPNPTTQDPSSASNSPSRNQRLKTISISILRSVARKRDFSSGTHPASPPGPSAIQSLSPALQSVLSDHHHHTNELGPIKRPFFIVDVRSVTAAAERHQANPNQIRRVEECKRFFSLRYEPIFTTLAEGKPPPSLVKVAEWRRKLQLVSILRKKREQSFRSSSQGSSELLRRPLHEGPSSAEELRLKLRMTIDQPPNLLLSVLPHQQNTYKWICLSARKRRTMWEICPEDVQAYMSTQGAIEDEEELREAERLFGRFDEHPIRHPKSSRQRVNSNKAGSSRWFNDSHHGSISDNDSARSPHSGQTSFHSQNYHLRKHSSGTSSSRQIRASGSTSFLPETSQGLPRVSDLSNYRYSSDMSSSQDKYNRRQTNSDIDERDTKNPQVDPASHANPDLSVDVNNLSWSGKTPVSSPYVSSAILISPLEPRNNTRTSTTILPSTPVPDDYHTPPQSKTNPSTVQSNLAFPAKQPPRHSSDHGPRPSKPTFVKAKAKKYHSGWSATDEAGNAPSSGSSPLRSNSQPALVPPLDNRHSKQRLSSLARGMTTSHSNPATNLPGSPEKPNLSRNASAKGLLHFAKRSIIPDIPGPSPLLIPDRILGPTSSSSSTSFIPPHPPHLLHPVPLVRPSKLSFFHKPPRDWKGWKFDKSHLIFRNSNNNQKKVSVDLLPPVTDILFVSPFHQPLRTPTHLPKTAAGAAALHSFANYQSVNLPILVTDLTDEEVQETQMLIVMLTSQLEHSEMALKECRDQEYRKYAALLPQIREEIGLEEIPIRKKVGWGCSDQQEDEGRGVEGEGGGGRRNSKGKGVQVSLESDHSSSSTTTEGSVLSRSVQEEEDQDRSEEEHRIGRQPEVPAVVEVVRERLDVCLAQIDATLVSLESHKLAFRARLEEQIRAREAAIYQHELFLASCSERQELMRKDRDLVNQVRRTIKLFGQEARSLDHLKAAFTDGISRPIISALVSFLSKLIGIALKLFALHSAVYRAPFKGLFGAVLGRWIYVLLDRHAHLLLLIDHSFEALVRQKLSSLLLAVGLDPSGAWASIASAFAAAFRLAKLAFILLNLSILLISLLSILSASLAFWPLRNPPPRSFSFLANDPLHHHPHPKSSGHSNSVKPRVKSTDHLSNPNPLSSAVTTSHPDKKFT
ncbi:hypothetical protein PGT21_020388 [Puccinia graminis f. sp. tritici]|uniref:Uncharacterized protein n=1 Tax=Puccinia graminis f. sp. tritici TaxID=56615 RepID=A0A5B0QB99_PUCGR|nr:hypothetical protein PGT21_020388 [Puccinia graminis f. sp. tritici]